MPENDFDYAHYVNLTSPTQYRLAKYRQMETRNGVAWNAQIKLGKTVVGDIEQTGRGGPADVRLDRAHREAFVTEAAARYPHLAEEYARIEAFAGDLATLTDCARARGVTFARRPEDLVDGELRRFRVAVTLEQAVAYLRDQMKDGDPTPLVFDKAAHAFREVTDFDVPGPAAGS